MLQDEEIDRVLTETRLKAYTSKTITAEINSRLEAAAGPFAMATRQGESS
jgi:hypothetical protein